MKITKILDIVSGGLLFGAFASGILVVMNNYSVEKTLSIIFYGNVILVASMFIEALSYYYKKNKEAAEDMFLFTMLFTIAIFIKVFLSSNY